MEGGYNMILLCTMTAVSRQLLGLQLVSRAARRYQGGQGEQRATVCGSGIRLTDGRAILYILRLRFRPT